MDTFPSLFLQQTQTRSPDPAIRYKRHGLWGTITWGEADQIVREIACGLASKGIKPEDKIAIVGQIIPQLYLSMVAIQCLGAIPVPIHPDSMQMNLLASLITVVLILPLFKINNRLMLCMKLKSNAKHLKK